MVALNLFIYFFYFLFLFFFFFFWCLLTGGRLFGFLISQTD